MGTILTAFVLAITVWVSAVVAEDPDEVRVYPRNIPLEIVGMPADLLLVSEIPDNVQIRLQAPSSVWDQMVAEANSVQAKIDLSDLEAGEYTLPLEVSIGHKPVRVILVTPNSVSIVLENLMTAEKIVRPVIVGEPALGFRLEHVVLGESRVRISGPESLVSMVDQVQAELDVSGVRVTLSEQVELRPVDEAGQLVNGITLSPSSVDMLQPVTQLGGFRDLAVKVETEGVLSVGYRVTNISVSPPTLTVFSSDPELVAAMPGFVRTLPVNLDGVNDDIEIRLLLDLPEGVTLVGEEQNVQVQVGVAAIETSISLQVPVEVVGLDSEFMAELSPSDVGVLLSGPLTVLENLEPEDIVVVVNLADLGLGSHLVSPEVVTFPDRVTVDAIIPETIEVSILVHVPQTETPAPTSTITP